MRYINYLVLAFLFFKNISILAQSDKEYYKKILDNTNLILLTDSENVFVKEQKAVALINLSELSEAKKILLEITSNQLSSKESKYNLSYVFYRLGLYDSSIIYLNQLLSIDSTAKYLTLKASILFEKKQYKVSYDLYSKAISKGGGIENMKGCVLCLIFSNKFQEAFKLSEIGFSISKDSEFIVFKIYCLVFTKKSNEVIDYIHKNETKLSRDEINFCYSVLYSKEKKQKKACKFYNSISKNGRSKLTLINSVSCENSN